MLSCTSHISNAQLTAWMHPVPTVLKSTEYRICPPSQRVLLDSSVLSSRNEVLCFPISDLGYGWEHFLSYQGAEKLLPEEVLCLSLWLLQQAL